MSLIDIILLAIALGIDCLVVSFSQGLIFNKNRTTNSLKLAAAMGLFQGLMPCIGYTGANYIYELIAPFSKWIVFGIFLILGIKFILEAFEEQKEKICCIDLRCLISLGVATSIDVMSLSGFWFGNFFKKFPPKYLEITGGVILIFLAAKSIIF